MSRQVHPRQNSSVDDQESARSKASASPDGFSQALEWPALGTILMCTPFCGERSVSGSGKDASPKMTVLGIVI